MFDISTQLNLNLRKKRRNEIEDLFWSKIRIRKALEKIADTVPNMCKRNLFVLYILNMSQVVHKFHLN